MNPWDAAPGPRPVHLISPPGLLGLIDFRLGDKTMGNHRKRFIDRFTFNLRGMTATASFFITPVIADDTINRAWDEKLERAEREKPGKAHECRVTGPIRRRSVSSPLG